MPTVLEQLHSAMNQHDLEAMLQCILRPSFYELR